MLVRIKIFRYKKTSFDGIQEVRGSIPLISTIEALKTIGFDYNCCCMSFIDLIKNYAIAKIVLIPYQELSGSYDPPVLVSTTARIIPTPKTIG